MKNETCYQANKQINDSWCPPIFDDWLCWPSTPPGEKVTLDCPQVKGILVGGKAYRLCMNDGKWELFNETTKPKGYTHYDGCIIPQLKDLLKMCSEIEECPQIVKITRNIEMIGLSFSLISLIISLYIFYQYRILKNNRTKIHKNLFIATLLQVIFRLIRYVDQEFKEEDRLIERTTYLNESCIALLEYTKTAMFMWMFIEGLYLHNMITVTVFQEYSYIKIYLYVGWLAPGLMTAIWVITMLLVKSNWAFYYFLPYYWILEGPRSVIIIVNLLFLINIVRVLIVKLRESRTSEIEQVRKAVRAAIFLLPLMGIANIFFWVDYRFTVAWKFALWSYTSYFLNTFQGFFVAVLYCFLNGEVQAAIRNSFYLHMSLRNHDYTPCRNLTMISTAPEPENSIANNDGPKWMKQYLKPFEKNQEEHINDCDGQNSSVDTSLTMSEKRRSSKSESWPQLTKDNSNITLEEKKFRD